MRVMLDTVAMRGVVVIGEGEKDEAPMLFNGEEVGDGTGPRSTSPSTRSRARGSRLSGCRTRSPSSPSPSAGRCSSPAPRCTWTRSPSARRRRTRSTSTRRRPRTSQRVAEAKGVRGQRPHRRRPRARPPRRPDRRAARGGRTREPHPRRRRRARDRRRAGRAPASTCSWASAGRPRASSRPRRSSAWAARCRGSCGRATTTSARRLLEAGYDLDRVLTADDLVQRRGRLRRRDRRHERRAAARRPRRRRPRRDRVDRDALALGHVPPHRRLASTDEDPEPDERSALDGSARAARDRTGDRRRPQGHPRGRRVDRHDQEALRLDRRRVDRGEPALLPPAAVHGTRAWRTPSAA